MTRTDGAPANAIDLPTLTADAGLHEDGRPVSVAIVAASWYDEIMAGLIAGAVRACADAAIEPDIVRVPGSFELPLGAQAALHGHDAVVALGVVVRGGTPHFDYVCQGATNGLPSRPATAPGCPAPPRTTATRRPSRRCAWSPSPRAGAEGPDA